jgi:hypothetical protein
MFVNVTAGDNKKKFITREEEPDEAWVSKGEKDGENPMKVRPGVCGC